LVISGYERENGVKTDIKLSGQEKKVLYYLYNGFSQTEIAGELDVTFRTVNMFYKNIQDKLGAKNIADIVRITAEKKLI